jgi:hypothetical protein
MHRRIHRTRWATIHAAEWIYAPRNMSEMRNSVTWVYRSPIDIAILLMLRRRISRHCSCALAHSLQCLPGGSLCAIAIHHLPFAICHLPFAICHLPFAICHLPFAICRSPFAIRHSPFAVRHRPQLSPPCLHPSPFTFAVRCSLFAVRCSLFVCCFPSPMLSHHCSPCRLFCHLNGCRRQSGFPSPSAALDFPLVMELCSMECGGGSRQMVNGQWRTVNSAL